jgi:Na+/proline symporter
MDSQYLAVILAGLVLLLGTVQGIHSRKKIQWTEFSRGPSGVGTFRAWFSLVVSLIGSFMVFSLVQMAYEGGLTPILLGLAYPISLFLILPVVKKLREQSSTDTGIIGIDSILEKSFGKVTTYIFWIAQIIAFFGILAGQFLAIGEYVKIFHGVDQLALAIILGAIAPVLYTTVSGFYGVVKNDMIQGFFVLCFLIILIIPYSFSEGVSIPDFSNEGNPFGVYGAVFAIAGSLVLIPTLAARADIWQRMRICETSKRGRTLILTFFTVFTFYVLISLLGWAVKSLASQGTMNIGNPSDVLPVFIKTYLRNEFLRAILMASILSALVSSIDSYLSITSLSFVRIVAKKQWEAFDKGSNEQGNELLKASRFTTILVALFSGILSYILPNIVDLFVASFSIIAVCTPIVLLSVFSKQRFRDWFGAVSIGSGLIVWLIAMPFLGKVAFLPGIIISFFTMLVLYRAGKTTPA